MKKTTVEIRPVFEWRDNRLYIGAKYFGLVYATLNKDEYLLDCIIFIVEDYEHFKTIKEAKQYLEAVATKILYKLLHGAQYEVSE